VYVYIHVLNYGCGSIVRTFGLWLYTSEHVNYKLKFISLIFMCMLTYETMVEGILILNKWISGVVTEVFPREGG